VETPSPEQSPKYQESNLSTSATDTDDGRDGGSQYRIEPSSGGTQFTGEKHKLTMLLMYLIFHTWLIVHLFPREADFTHATQDTDHGAPLSQWSP
jgi:hypothetical protein